MSKFNSLITKRFRTEKASKVHPLADRSSFAGIFQVTPISDKESETLHKILVEHADDDAAIEKDLEELLAITSEVKAINNQAIILHGERIKKAQMILKNYKDGAFSSWLIETYGNRQTPYNFLQYFDLYTSLDKPLQTILDEMPRQAIYSLSSRNGSLEEKQAFILNYKGETKNELLTKLREKFPLPSKDKRKSNSALLALTTLENALKLTKQSDFLPNPKQKKELQNLLTKLQERLNG